jgi:tRNA G18 (ribose-2'-O)-methylase SpoU
MPSAPIHIDSLDDPRLAVYRNLKDRELARENSGRRFIAESEHVVRRLLASSFAVDSVLLAQRCVDEINQIVPPSVPLYVVPDAMMHRVVGFKFHSGVIACGVRKTDTTLEQILPPIDQPSTIVVCPELANYENLGSLIRIAAALGADAVLLGERCCDPFYRLSIRVSMGSIFSLPMCQSQDIMKDMARLRTQWGYELIASVLDGDAEPLNTATRRRRIAILLGNEAQGLSRQEIAACDRRVTIPMSHGTDSLNVTVAAGIILHHFTRDVDALVPSPGTPGEG